MKSNSKALLDLEGKTSPLESKLVFNNECKYLKSQSAKPSAASDMNKKTTPVPSQSQFLGKVKDFLGVISEANKKLEIDAKKNPEHYDIEALTGEESQFIEMDLMLGVAELQSDEAIAAAESAMAGYQPVITLASSSETDSEDSSDDDDDDDDDAESDEDKANFQKKGKNAKLVEGDSSSSEETSRNKKRSRKKPKIVELS
ncbi:unnamed protein product [Cuscuta campestris]|uniref:Uncharacterized protein n=1 Tax=Cuscuta campestris TaxID=132261 RepID=A0A484K505_9ASTE|nr:unnamed protein product [Cuscuta campestris]